MQDIIPSTIAAGLTFSAQYCGTDYPADTWTLVLLLRGPSSVTLTADADGVFTAAPDVTVTWTPGEYAWSIRANSADGTVLEVQRGSVTVTPDFAAIPDGTDQRSHAQRTLDAISAVIEKRASRDQERYTINNRELWRTPLSDLLKLRAVYVAKVRREKGGGVFREIDVVF